LLNLIGYTYQLFQYTGIFFTMCAMGLTLALPAAARKYGLKAVLSTFGFALADLLVLCSLHGLRLSYGPILFPWLVLVCVRAGLYLLWVVCWFLPSSRTHPAPAEASTRFYQIVQAAVLLVVIYAFMVEPFWLTTTHWKLETEKIEAGRNLRIVQLSDFHVERLTKRERQLVGRVNDLKPDVIVITGDYPNLSYTGDAVTWQQITWLVSQLKAPLGVYLVDGSVESANRVIRLANDTHTTALEDRVVRLPWDGGNVELIGAKDEIFHQAPVDELHALYHEVAPDAFSIVLFHTPDLVGQASTEGADLYLCGHTHGGQIRLPVYGAVITSSVYHKQYEMGKYKVGTTWMYVNRGIGMEGKEAPRARFLAPPEILVIDLTGTGGK
jgi:predicted MPP superfamily phosphohydrolase